jgi:hypothetical protein
MKKSLVLVAIAALLAGSTAFANDADKDKTVKCKDTKGKVTMVKSADECTKSGGTVEK